MTWKIGRAKQNLSKVIRAAAVEPQKIYKRNHLVAAVVDGQTFEEFEDWKRERDRQRPLAEAFEELRSICAEEAYELPEIPRLDRGNPFIEDTD